MKLKVLFIDDDYIQLDIMKEYMSLCDLENESEFFNNANEALEHLKSNHLKNLPNIVFVDVFMPRMNGWETIKNMVPIMKSKKWDPSIYIISSSVSKIDREKAAKEPHIKSFLTKPFNFKSLMSTLENEYKTTLAT